MEEYSDEELNERHKQITNQLELADTEDLEREEKELEEDFDRHRHVCRQEYERKMTELSQEYKRKMVELSQKQAKKKRLEEQELSIGCELERRNRAKQLELDRQRQDLARQRHALAERRSRIRSKSRGRSEVGLEEARSRSGARSELELEEATSQQDDAGGEDEEDSGIQCEENRQAQQHPPTPANPTSSVTNASDEAWFRRLPDFGEIKEAAAKVDPDSVLFCTSCQKALDMCQRDNLHRHPDLGVLICSDCLLKYNQDDWTNYPATGDFEQCRRYLARVKRVNWSCLMCDPHDLVEHRATMWAIIEFHKDDHDEEDVEQNEGEDEAQDNEAPVTFEELLPGASEGGQTTQEKDVDELYEDFSSLFKAYQMKPGEKRNEELNKIVGAIYSKTQAGGEKFNLGVYTHPDFDKHRDKEYEWPERASRIKSIMEALDEGGILNKAMELSEERLASKEDILLVHSPDRWAEGEQLEGMTDEERSKWNDKMYEEQKSLYAGEDTFFCARLAAGGLLVAVDTIFALGFSGLIFAVIRPPGHHACIKHGGGFCHLNNISIGAAYAIQKYNLVRVVILDFDVHHGQGSEIIWFGESRVLYISLHRIGEGFYPETGESSSVGEGEGVGFNANFAFNSTTIEDADYLPAFSLALLMIREFNPELIMVSAGFDGVRGDRLGKWQLSPGFYGHMTRALLNLFDGKVPIVYGLEGGYNKEAISKCAVQCCKAVLGEELDLQVPEKFTRRGAAISAVEGVLAHHDKWACINKIKMG